MCLPAVRNIARSLFVSLLELLFFFCWRLLGLIPGGAPFSQLSSGVKDAMVISTKVKCHFVTKTCRRPVETTLERGRNKKPSTNRNRTAEEGSGDVRKTTPMPERKQQHRQKMALVKPRGSTYARASVQVTRKWRIWNGVFIVGLELGISYEILFCEKSSAR